MQQKKLGKGLKALIPDTAVLTAMNDAPEGNAEQLQTVPVAAIFPRPDQPRTFFAPEAITELAQSIKTQGLIQPLVVRPADNGYELIAGERRFRAIKELGMTEVPVIIKDIKEAGELLQLSLIENLQREDLNPVEEAKAYQRLIETHGLTQEELSYAIGKDRSSVANSVRLLRLPEKAQQALINGLITAGHAKVLMSLPTTHEQLRHLDLIIAKKLSVRALEDVTKKTGRSKAGIKQKAPQDPHTTMLVEELQRKLGTKVAITHNQKRGKIIIDYYSPTDFERILNLLGIAVEPLDTI